MISPKTLHVSEEDRDRKRQHWKREVMCQMCERISLFTPLVQGLASLLVCLVSLSPKERTHTDTQTHRHTHTYTNICRLTSTHFLYFLHHLQYSLFLIPSFLWSSDWKVLLCNICTQVCGLHTAASQRAVCFSPSAVGQYSGFTQGAKVLMLHALKKYKMSSLQL